MVAGVVVVVVSLLVVGSVKVVGFELELVRVIVLVVVVVLVVMSKNRW